MSLNQTDRVCGNAAKSSTLRQPKSTRVRKQKCDDVSDEYAFRFPNWSVILGTIYEPGLVEWKIYAAKVDVRFNLVVRESPCIPKTRKEIYYYGEASSIVILFTDPNERTIHVQGLAMTDDQPASSPIV